MSQLSTDLPSADIKEEKTEQKDPSISFIEQVETALNQAKSSNKILIVLCEKEQLISSDIWNHSQIIKTVQKHAICLLIRENTLAFTQFTVLYPVIAFPTVYCINPQNGQVLLCKYAKEEITVQSLTESIANSYALMLTQSESQTQVPSANTNIQKQPNSVKSKLEQIREKAKAQKLRKSPPNSAKKSETKPVPKSKVSKPIKKSKPLALNNYNFNSNKMDVIEGMELTRRNKLRKRKKKSEHKYKRGKDASITANTPIMSAVKDSKIKENIALNKQARLVFRMSDGIDIQKYFDYNCTLLDVMSFVIGETGMTDFVFVSQYPPLHIDSIYLDSKMSGDSNGLFEAIMSEGSDEKSNESMYDKVQSQLSKSIYELNLVPSARVFIRPKLRGRERSEGNGENIVMRVVCFVFDLIKTLIGYGYDGLVWLLWLLWEILNVPLRMIGIGNGGNGGNGNEAQRSNGNVNGGVYSARGKGKGSKLKPYKRGKSGIQRLSHLESEDDKNKYSNGNGTVYGGDGKK